MGKLVKLAHSAADPVRLAFPHIWTKRAGMVNADGSTSEPKYEATAILKPGGANAKAIMAAIAETGADVYGKDWKVAYDEEFSDDQRGLRKGNLKKSKDGVVYDGFEDMVYVTAKSKERIPAYDTNGALLADGDGRPYGGCYVDMNVEVWPLKKQGAKKRFVCDLKGIRFRSDGDSFGSGTPVSKPDDFADLSAEESLVD